MSFDAKALQRWRGDCAAWAEECVEVRNPETGELGPLRLLEHQAAWLREATRRADGRFARKVTVASWPKRDGKTLCAALVIAWRCACFTDQRCGIIANSERQAQSNIFDAVTGFFRDSPKLKGYVPKGGYQTSRLSLPALRNEVSCFPCNAATVQGTRFDVLACDELHASDDGGKAFVFASQQTEAADAQAVIASQAGAPVTTNPMWRLHQAAEGGAEHIFFSYRTEPATPWGVRRSEEARLELTPGEHDYLWRNAWGATGLRLFAAADVERAAVQYASPRTREEWQALRAAWGWEGVAVAVGVGLDRAGVGRGGDRSVWTVTAKAYLRDADPVFRVLVCGVLPTGAEREVLQADRETREVYGDDLDGVLFESYGCSDLVEKVRRAELVSPTSQRQQGLFNRLHRLMAEGRIQFPADAGADPRTGTPGLLKSELVTFAYDCEREGATKFGTQRGAHDDTVYSLAWSCEAADGEAGERKFWWQDKQLVRELYGAGDDAPTEPEAATPARPLTDPLAVHRAALANL